MKQFVRIGWLLSATLTAAQPTNAIRQVVLDPNIVVRIAIGRDRLTTVRFPSPISDLEGLFISADSEPPARFQISFRPGNSFFSLRALTTNSAVNLNVVWKRRTYILELVESAQPLFSVVFVESNLPPHSASSSTVNEARIREMFDIAKNYTLLQAQHSGTVSGVQYARPAKSFAYRDCNVGLEEVFGFRLDDALLFRLTLTNKTEKPVHYEPRSLAAGIGQSYLPATAIEANGVVPARGEATAWFAIIGGLNGTPIGISPLNEFTIFLNLPVASPPETPWRRPDLGSKRGALDR